MASAKGSRPLTVQLDAIDLGEFRQRCPVRLSCAFAVALETPWGDRVAPMEPSKAHELAGGQAQSGLYRNGNPVQYRDREELICSGDGRDVKAQSSHVSEG